MSAKNISSVNKTPAIHTYK